MTNLFDKNFWLQVLVCAALLVVFIYFLYFGKGKKKSSYEEMEIARCKHFKETLISVIQESESEQELDSYQGEAEQFFIDNYDCLGHSISMKFYNEMTLAGINRRKILNPLAVNSLHRR